jgi:predicted DNA-binding transcriptional regulator AlpA
VKSDTRPCPAATRTVSVPSAALLTKGVVAALVAVTTRTIDRWTSTGQFPAPLRLGNGPKPRVRWRRADVEAWLEQQAKR